METKRIKKLLQTVLKFVVTGLAIFFVIRTIDLHETKRILSEAKYGYLLLATLFFIASKVVSSLRLNQYFSAIDLKIAESYNLRLYWIGMFYNLFLPGGIGGDGYKVYLLNKQYRTPVKQLIAATLIDRISGLMALLFLLLVLAVFLAPFEFMYGFDWVIYVALIIGYPIYFVFNKLFFKSFVRCIWQTSIYSLFVQGLQLICAWFILLSLEITEAQMAYQLLFLASSVVAVLPFTIGGVGARELTFILGHQYLGIDQNAAVAFSVLFFLITLVVSAAGGFLTAKADTSAREFSQQENTK
ncbi:MAG: lysylphosphatidylglycerol synthase transmembrane domain-containing protein [Bacteroidota bacterium]